MQKTTPGLVALCCIVCFSPADASASARVTALQSTAWVEQDNNKTKLTTNSDLKIGDHVSTNESGRVEMQLWSSTILRLYSNSEIRLLAKSKTGLATPDNQLKLFVHKGKICVNYKPAPNAQNILELSIGNTIVTTVHHHSHICMLREDGLSSIDLRDGSVQITHSIDPSMIILSESGTELRIDDDGSYELLKPGASASITPESDISFITETNIDTVNPVEIIEAVESVETPETVEGDIAVIEEIATEESQPTPIENAPNYIYTVYLFSTRDEDVANEVNKRFQAAGHESEIIVNGKDSSKSYRIAVSGFKSRQSAQEFSSSVVGRLGISGTWIGKERQSVDTPETVEADVAVVEEIVTEESQPTTNENESNYIYTVYLFSTRDEDVANAVNKRFQTAGHESEIIVNGKDSSLRYRIAVSGFKSRQSANEFSSSMVGKLGISDTWIGWEQLEE